MTLLFILKLCAWVFGISIVSLFLNFLAIASSERGPTWYMVLFHMLFSLLSSASGLGLIAAGIVYMIKVMPVS